VTLQPSGYIRRDVQMRDGRVVEVLLAGHAGGSPLLLHHGTPMAAAPQPAFDRAAVAGGFRVISFSRPGYGASSGLPSRQVADVAGDAREVLDALGVRRFVTAGLAGGGPYALACAALMPDRCAGAAALGCVAPFDAAGLDWFAGMSDERVEEIEIAVRDAPRYGEMLGAQVDRLLDATSPDQLAAAMAGRLADPDRRAIRRRLAAGMFATMQLAFLGGAGGWLADELAMLRPWGFDPEKVRAPLTFWHGGADCTAPLSHGRWLADRVPGATCRIVFDEGHWSLPAAVAGAAVETLASFAERQPTG
jgi:pimeloyl-ACP methyl ester carboxylesterase